MIAAAGAAVLVGYLSWWTSPEAFGGHGNGLGHREPAIGMQPLQVNMAESFAGEETITLRAVEANVIMNTAGADIAFAVCNLNGAALLSQVGRLDEVCTSTAPIEGQELTLGGGHTFVDRTIVMTVTPHEPGVVVVRGMDVEYRRGPRHLWQTGTELAGPDVRLRVVP